MEHVFHLFVCRINNRDEFIQSLKNKGIQALVHYPIPLHQQDFFRQWRKGRLVKSEQYSKEIFSLPLHPFLEDSEAEKIILAVNSE